MEPGIVSFQDLTFHWRSLKFYLLWKVDVRGKVPVLWKINFQLINTSKELWYFSRKLQLLTNNKVEKLQVWVQQTEFIRNASFSSFHLEFCYFTFHLQLFRKVWLRLTSILYNFRIIKISIIHVYNIPQIIEDSQSSFIEHVEGRETFWFYICWQLGLLLNCLCHPLSTSEYSVIEISVFPPKSSLKMRIPNLWKTQNTFSQEL